MIFRLRRRVFDFFFSLYVKVLCYNLSRLVGGWVGIATFSGIMCYTLAFFSFLISLSALCWYLVQYVG